MERVRNGILVGMGVGLGTIVINGALAVWAGSVAVRDGAAATGVHRGLAAGGRWRGAGGGAGAGWQLL